ncbi:MAG TPA: transglycosylase SLT domain-containing protein [Woeseiaceae bacterium]|nr:transglycosylase SLT domain-containing protein [Woeseiaceae bacterium]
MRPLSRTCLALMVASIACAAPAATIDEQRAAFREVYPAAERGEWEPIEEKRPVLEDYVLWPDLKAAWLRSHLDDAREVEQFLEQYGSLKAARELRYRLALRLANEKRFPEYLEIYRRWYANLEIAKLDCLAVHADILAGSDASVASRGRDLWLIGRSQAEECDPVFEYLRGAGVLDEQLYRDRFELAITERQFSLARYLARSLDQRHLEQANRWIAAQNGAGEFLQSAHADRADDELYREQLTYALERLSYSDAELAAEHWRILRRAYAFPADEARGIARHIALWLARQHNPEGFQALRDLPPEAVDVEVRRWLVRSALRQHSWPDVVSAIAGMPGDERTKEEWQYWLAVAWKETGNVDEARTIFEAIAGERSYFGFLAADEIGSDYAWAHTSLQEDTGSLKTLAANAALVRARELFYVGLESRGRSEWDDAVSMLPPGEKAQAALLAHRWGWHSRAIATAASVSLYDDLELRYPLPYREQFERHSRTAAIPDSWAYGVARSESLFMADIRSIAGAVGVMQLMPSTGRRTASEIKLPYNGIDTLTDPDSNIRLGTFYLGKMLQRFGDNAVLATAAYNAGPARVEQWLPDEDQLDARIWIENIPFNETRGYVRRVLATDAIFHWRLTGKTRRLSHHLAAIDPASRTQQSADAARRTMGGP